MKKSLIAVLGLVCLSLVSLQAADKTAKEKFYGKITSIDLAARNITVHNTRQDADARFEWDDQTNLVSNKKPIQPADLKIGQSLYIAFVTENDKKKATFISVRTPFKKTQQ